MSGNNSNPSTELIDLLERFDQRIASARRLRYIAAPDTFTSSRWDRLLGRNSSSDSATMAAAISAGLQDTPKKKSRRGNKPTVQRMAPPEIIEFPDVEGCVEDLRRMAELCVIGENYVTNVEKQNAAYEAAEAAEWKRLRDGLGTSFSKLDDEKPIVDPDCTTKGRLFDLFFERHGLKKIVEMLNGELFQRKHFTKEMEMMEGIDGGSNHSEDQMPLNDPILLPPIAIATQALQSASILIQNCSRITSLYVILSNNYINQLIDLPLQLYEQVDRRTRHPSARIFANPEITELTTHFVTFLKSLAIRMNAETLQFFLSFHTNESTKKTTVDFPLYERALEFCVADQDSFVRTTALSICLNTLRLTTPAATADAATQPIPWETKLCLAEYACHPSRVEHLIAPTFARCAQAWSMVDEHIREMDACRLMSPHEESFSSMRSSWNERARNTKERTQKDRWMRGFREKVDNLIDELLLLDDIFKVGLTVLNEQLIERMLATFVYPLLLQPLVEYCHQLDSSVDEDRFSFSDHPFGGISVDLSDVQKSLLNVAGPAKAALLTLSIAFQYLSNRPLLRLMFTVLFHPLLPDTTKAPTVRSQLQVATVDPQTGEECIRLDSPSSDDDRMTYEFGTTRLNRRRPSSDDLEALDSNESCTFVLAPALAEVLEFRGDGKGDLGLLSRTRPNPYRKAFWRCLGVPQNMADVRDLAVCTLDAVLAAFDQGGQFRSAVLYGSDLRRRLTREDEDVPADERTLDSKDAHDAIDRDLGRTSSSSPCTETSAQSIVRTNFVSEVVTAICGSVTTAHRIASDDWTFQYDCVAMHALLLAVDQNPSAMTTACRILESRQKQASSALAAIPSTGLMPMGGSTSLLPGAPSINADDYEEQMYEAFLNAVFYDAVYPNDKKRPLIEGFVRLKDIQSPVPKDGLAVPTSRLSNLKEMTTRVVGFLTEEMDEMVTQAFSDLVDARRESAHVLLQLDAGVTLLKDLAATSGAALRESKLAGIVIAGDGRIVQFDPLFSRCQDVYSNVSTELTDFLFTPPPTAGPDPETIIDLNSNLALFCVCEVSGALSHYFGEAGVESDGITWQSLCLTFLNGRLVFCRPISPTEASVLGSCDMERLSAEMDPSLPNASATAARRLGLVYSWFDTTPPPLFLFDAEPVYKPCDGDLNILDQICPWKSRVDLWFENGEAVEQAYEIMTQQCFFAKRERGQRIQKFLDPNMEQLNASSTFW